MVRRQRHRDSRQDYSRADQIHRPQRRAQPEPLDEGGDGRGEALRQQNSETWPNARQGGEERYVSHPKPHYAAEEKPRQGSAAQPAAENVRPEREENCGQADATKVRELSPRIREERAANITEKEKRNVVSREGSMRREPWS